MKRIPTPSLPTAIADGDFHAFPDSMANTDIWTAYEGFAKAVVEAESRQLPEGPGQYERSKPLAGKEPKTTRSRPQDLGIDSEKSLKPPSSAAKASPIEGC